MRRVLAGLLAVVAVLSALALATPSAAEAAPETRQPTCSHEWVESTYVQFYVDPAKAPSERVLKVWIADHRAKRLARHSWTHAHVAQSDMWVHVEILTTQERWSGWVYCGAEHE